MALTSGPNLGLLVNGLQGEVHYTNLMAMWRGLDALVQTHAKSATVAAQPGSPADGDTYIVPTGATGTPWSTNTGKIARYSSVAVAWEFYTGKKGWMIYVEDTNSEWLHDGTSFKYIQGYGTTANRPSANILTGAMYFNTTTGKPNWYSGSGWVDATGTAA
jgi:hypothetical protein